MREVHSFEYATIRVVPKVEREEFVNVGVILYCPSQKFLQVMTGLNEQKVLCMSPKTDIAEVRSHLAAICEIASGSSPNSPISRLDIASRFRWITAVRSTVVQSSRVHPGLCLDPQRTLEKLFSEMVL